MGHLYDGYVSHNQRVYDPYVARAARLGRGDHRPMDGK